MNRRRVVVYVIALVAAFLVLGGQASDCHPLARNFGNAALGGLVGLLLFSLPALILATSGQSERVGCAALLGAIIGMTVAVSFSDLDRDCTVARPSAEVGARPRS